VLNAVFGKEHVLGAAEADAFGAEEASQLGVAGDIGVGADAERRTGSTQLMNLTRSGSSGWASMVLSLPAMTRP